MNRKRMAKKILKMFNLKLPVEYSYGYAVEYDTDFGFSKKLFVSNYGKYLDPASIRFERAYSKWHKDMGIPISEDLFAILHEVGHIMTEKEFDHEIHTNDLDTLAKLYENKLIDEENYAILYNKIDAEQKANEFAINWIKNHEFLAKTLDKQLH